MSVTIPNPAEHQKIAALLADLQEVISTDETGASITLAVSALSISCGASTSSGSG